MSNKELNWDKSIKDIVNLYRDIERRSLAVPIFSIYPILISLWNVIKFEVFFLLDTVLLIPMNAVILIRNILPGKWRYRSFSYKYFKYGFLWIWRGETPSFPLVVVKPLVTLILGSHIRSRLKLLQRYIYLNDHLSDEERTSLISRLTIAQEHWKRPGIINYIFSFVLPIVPLIIGIYRYKFPTDSHNMWLNFVGLTLIIYAIAFLITAFIVKRGLMLGASGRATYFPGGIKDAYCYTEEKRIFGAIGILKKEFPIDMLLTFVSITIGIIFLKMFYKFYVSIGLIPSSADMIDLKVMAVQYICFAGLCGFILYRRIASGRA